MRLTSVPKPPPTVGNGQKRHGQGAAGAACPPAKQGFGPVMRFRCANARALCQSLPAVFFRKRRCQV